MLEIRLLGQYALAIDGRPLTISSRPARLLLAYTLLHQMPHPREHLAELLWPDSTPDNARSNLRHALWQLRTDLADCGCDAPLLHITEHDIGLNVACALWLDTAVLEAPIRDDTPLDAVEAQLCVYQGELLPGHYESWIVLERERLKAILGLRMSALLERLAAADRWRAVVDWAERWIAFDEQPEAAYRYLMLAHAELGDVGLAEGAYRRCCQMLAGEFEAEPSPATLALAARLHQHRAAVDPAAPDLCDAPATPCRQPAAQPDRSRPDTARLSAQLEQMRLEQAHLRRDLWLLLLGAGLLLALSRWRRETRDRP